MLKKKKSEVHQSTQSPQILSLKFLCSHKILNKGPNACQMTFRCPKHLQSFSMTAGGWGNLLELAASGIYSPVMIVLSWKVHLFFLRVKSVAQDQVHLNLGELQLGSPMLEVQSDTRANLSCQVQIKLQTHCIIHIMVSPLSLTILIDHHLTG